jgi:hypothetical protein
VQENNCEQNPIAPVHLIYYNTASLVTTNDELRKTIRKHTLQSKNNKIGLEWANSEGGNTQVVMNFEPLNKDSTLVRIKEYGWKNQTQESLDESYSHCHGWMQMLCCLKVYIEFGKNLREILFLGPIYFQSDCSIYCSIDHAQARVIKSLFI